MKFGSFAFHTLFVRGRAVHGLGRDEGRAQRGAIRAQGQRGEIGVGRADDGEQAEEAVAVGRRRRRSAVADARGGGSPCCCC